MWLYVCMWTNWFCPDLTFEIINAALFITSHLILKIKDGFIVSYNCQIMGIKKQNNLDCYTKGTVG